MSVILFLGPFPAQTYPLVPYILLGIAGAGPLLLKSPATLPDWPLLAAGFFMCLAALCDYV